MVRTRFAPSPTGYLHIGGVRTALFNWLFARGQGGSFVLRIDDTDLERNVEAALAPILEGFRWLGIDWDEGPEVGGPFGPYYQSERQDRYRAAAAALVSKGLAYEDYATREELDAERAEADAEKRLFLYSRRWMADTAEKRAAFLREGRTGVVRLKMPREGACTFFDHIRGSMSFDWRREQDHVIQRADGTCLYHLASVVDDAEMRITHVIRAEEHLSNTPRQIFIANGLGVSLPEYAHLPQVAEPGSKTKLSKRKIEKYLRNADFAKIHAHGMAIVARLGASPSPETFNPVLVSFYEEVGYLPHALVNYLMLLGWALDDRTEFLTRDEMVRCFTLARVNKASASFDPMKMIAFQDHYMRLLSVADRARLALPFLQRASILPGRPSEENLVTVERVVEAAGDRIKVAGDILEYDAFFGGDDHLAYVDADVEKWLRRPAGAAQLLAALMSELRKVDPFAARPLEETVRVFVEGRSIKMSDVVHALRVATTGRSVGFGLFEALAILGRDRCVRRIARALTLASTRAPDSSATPDHA